MAKGQKRVDKKPKTASPETKLKKSAGPKYLRDTIGAKPNVLKTGRFGKASSS